MLAPGTRVILRPGQSGVTDDVWHDVGDLVDLVGDLVDVDAVVVGDHFVVAVSTGVHQHAVFFVFAWVKHVVAFLNT